MSYAPSSLPPQSGDNVAPEKVDAFITRWKASSGSERSNYVSFLNELCEWHLKVEAASRRLSSKPKRQAAASTLPPFIYNVLEKLPSEDTDLTTKERKIHADGCISVLKQIHDELDAAVFDAYGWNDIPEAIKLLKSFQFYDFRNGSVWIAEFATAEQLDAAIKAHERTVEQKLLTRLVDFNRQRATEEAKDKVRWLRPEYQDPEFREQETGDKRRTDRSQAGGRAPEKTVPSPVLRPLQQNSLGPKTAPPNTKPYATPFSSRDGRDAFSMERPVFQ